MHSHSIATPPRATRFPLLQQTHCAIKGLRTATRVSLIKVMATDRRLVKSKKRTHGKKRDRNKSDSVAQREVYCGVFRFSAKKRRRIVFSVKKRRMMIKCMR